MFRYVCSTCCLSFGVISGSCECGLKFQVQVQVQVWGWSCFGCIELCTRVRYPYVDSH
jgi:hypothetical protein